MKLKYYLRGLGLGILVTAALMTYIHSGDRAVMTDSEIRARARELGMKDSVVLSELAGAEPETESETEQPLETETVTKTIRETETEAATETMRETETPEETEGAREPEAVQETEERESEIPPAERQADGAVIQINRGDGSEVVSRRLAEAGMVDSAASYNAYLCQNGYDKRLSIGVHEIPAGATKEEIAKILTGR